MVSPYIIVVDDEKEIVNTVSKYLSDRDYTVKGANSGKELFELLKDKKPDLIILDIRLPDLNGFEICKKLKENDKLLAIPIIILSADHAETDKVSGLDLGADDYVVKPFSLQELNARIKAILRRKSENNEKKPITVNERVIIDPAKYVVTIDGKEIALTSVEFRILDFLASRQGHVLSRKQILEHLWGEEKIVVARTIDVHIRHLREKLGDVANLIKNVRGFGYKLDAEN
ncbi:MAG: response regulator transcription factor [Candidatus Omnitrophica bacterium]|nr:response regulator transcription factor [Candidatus Omnitrophota bacterium]